ncbi:molybdopterin-guanine dinucleotide biosynthesis protein MobB [Desulfolutivibrio sulfoxidireducens]|uniref:molybdopterin-guanine dinucleotide biosynthesis protein MobB n=1 Tax=Desulfolutivibrio sulfoxidireducens TaxID=2773299 RepID=UPI00159E7731|nr:molybdopterin-guanine dinucleotide biosynthesis protein MobB [Desulfolutivibrio sulfoxidireducens]QLA15643.1 molybdopterin-guanine dinucleotide biosynthesis protein MobB [Desulfolutivibrio sulfoxidireducens]QLA19249.1 molybdopterin-guanine dinucleotide biosynthesis protein MobB [Desulfolutivibrio sulfoxidireducens]
MKAIQIVGYKKTGKTSLALGLTAALKVRGHAVAAAKFTHNPSLDKVDSDTGRLGAFCGAVAAFTPSESAVFWTKPRSFHEVLPLLDAEVLVVEGGKEMACMPRILTLRDPAEAEELGAGLAVATFGPVTAPGLLALREVEDVADLVLAGGFLLPNLNCGTCGEASCAAMAARIVAGDAVLGDCKATGGALRITINGIPLAAKPFVEDIISASLKAMLAQLKGYAPGRIELTLDA